MNQNLLISFSMICFRNDHSNILTRDKLLWLSDLHLSFAVYEMYKLIFKTIKLLFIHPFNVLHFISSEQLKQRFPSGFGGYHGGFYVS